MAIPGASHSCTAFGSGVSRYPWLCFLVVYCWEHNLEHFAGINGTEGLKVSSVGPAGILVSRLNGTGAEIIAFATKLLPNMSPCCRRRITFYESRD